MKRFLLVAALVILFSAPVAAQTLRRGLLPGVWWGTAPAGPPVVMQPVVRYRVWVPWWTRRSALYVRVPKRESPLCRPQQPHSANGPSR